MTPIFQNLIFQETSVLAMHKLYTNNPKYVNLTVREKLIRRGSSSLKDIELIQSMIGSGITNYGYKSISRDIHSLINKIGIENLTTEDLLSIKGIGPAKASLIFASLEFWRRKCSPSSKPIIDTPETAALQFKDLEDKKQENISMLTLDGARRVINKYHISKGTLTCSLVHPREIFNPAISDNAASIIIAHNHPSGLLAVSEQDLAVTKRIRDAGELIGIDLDDHLIITKDDFISAA